MDDDGNDGKDDVDLRSSFSHTLSLPPSLQAHHCPLPPSPPPIPRHFQLSPWPNFSFSLSGKASGESGMGFPS